jgi:hypothetical protein
MRFSRPQAAVLAHQYVSHGGYPGAAPLIRDNTRWARYILDSLV